MKIGEMVQRAAPAVFAYCETRDPAEFARLQDPAFSKQTFDINLPFCRKVETIGQEDHTRFYSQEHVVLGLRVRATSQWYNRSLPLFRQYLRQREIVFDEAVPDPVPAKPAPARGRYKSHAIGNAQNSFVRSLLGRLGEEQFNATHWQQVIDAFGGCCVYCGASGRLEMDHAIPINRQALGEHRLGNLVPACPACNGLKSEQDFRTFLAGQPERIAAIEAHMAKHAYVPIADNEPLRQIIEIAHQEVKLLADRYAAILDAHLRNPQDRT